MREILFRGKWVFSDEWIEGLLCRNIYEQLCIQQPGKGSCCIVHPDTVGQFTGLTDKHGKKAFEHDITEDGWGRRWIIFACDGGFGIRRNSEWLRNDPIYNALADAQNAAWFKDNHTIIGNIHDNPESVEG